jgi:hypothetical protein
MTPQDTHGILEHEQIQANIGKLIATTMRIHAEGDKFRRKTRWYPIVVVTASFAAGAAFVTALLSLAHSWLH